MITARTYHEITADAQTRYGNAVDKVRAAASAEAFSPENVVEASLLAEEARGFWHAAATAEGAAERGEDPLTYVATAVASEFRRDRSTSEASNVAGRAFAEGQRAFVRDLRFVAPQIERETAEAGR